MVGSSEQIHLLVEDLLSTLKPEEREILEALAVVDEFSTDEARIILQEKFSITTLNHFANESLFIKHSADPVQNYAFNSVVRAGLNISPQISEGESQGIHFRLSQYFAERGSYLKALEHAKSSGDQARYRTLFRQGMRQLIAIGRGKDLLRMAELVGDSSKAGRLKRQTVELIGLTADFQYLNAQSLIAEMLFTSQGTDLENFTKKFTSAVSVYIDFATGLSEQLEENVAIAVSTPAKEVDMAAIDKISILRVAAAKEIIYDNSNKLLEIEASVNRLAAGDTSPMVLYFTTAIHACALLNQGEFKDAFIVANNVIAQAEREGYVGIFGPLDAMFVKARCLLEFSQIEESQLIFEQIRNLATTWHQHIWVYVAESFMARGLALAGNSASALEIVRSERSRALSLTFKNGLETYCDLTELFIKYTMEDWGRVGVLLDRLPNFSLVEHVRAIYEFTLGKSSSSYEVAKLPMSSAKEQIYRFMALAEENIDREKEASKHIRSALEIGSRVGAKETFLRQDASILNLIIRIAGDNPTVYLEDLSSRIPGRLKARNENLVGLTAALTKRELEILRHLATGKPISAIAITLHISQNTMKTHLKNVYRKIGAGGRDEAVAKAKNLYIL
jgi:ATP/maltotriose-dependent transcriptional regulator MalT